MHKKAINTILLLTTFIAASFIPNDTTFIGPDVQPPNLSFGDTRTFDTALQHPAWLLGAFIFLFLIYMVIDKSLPGFTGENTLMLWNWNKLKASFEEKNLLRKKLLNISFVLGILTISYQIVLTLNKTNVYDTLRNVIAVQVTVTLSYIIFNLLISNIFDIKSLTQKLFTIYKLFISTLSFPALIASFMIIYGSHLLKLISIYGFLFILIAAYILKTIRQFQTFNESNFSKLYFILYLCSVEILPVLIILTILKH